MAARLTALVVIAIVAVTFVAGLIVGAQREDDGPIDLIVLNARVDRGDGVEPAEALAVRANQILRVGTNREMKRLKQRNTLVIDAHGGSVLPGFIDSSGDLLSIASASSSPVPAMLASTRSPDDARVRQVDAAIADAHRLGLTGVQAVTRTDADFAVLETLSKRGQLALRVSAALVATLPLTDAALASFDATRAARSENPLLRTSTIRLTLDDRQHAVAPASAQRRGKKAKATALTSADTLTEALAKLDAHNWQIIVRAEHLDSVPTAIEGFERLMARVPAARVKRHRLEVPEPLELHTMARIEALGVIAVMPAADESARLLASATPSASVPTSAQDTLAPGTATIAAGAMAVVVPAATTPVARPWPVGDVVWGSLRSSDQRTWINPLRDLDGVLARLPATVSPAMEARQRATFVRALTVNAVRASFDEARRGALAPGKLADFVVLSTDLFALPTAKLHELAVTVTVFDGKVAFEADAADGTPTP